MIAGKQIMCSSCGEFENIHSLVLTCMSPDVKESQADDIVCMESEIVQIDSHPNLIIIIWMTTECVGRP